VAEPREHRVPARFVFLSEAGRSGDFSEGSQRQPRVAWRILAANNRSMARSPRVYESLSSCFAAAKSLSERGRSATMTFESRGSRWTWSLAADREILAISTHEYQRRIECVRAARQFQQAIIEIEPDLMDVRAVGLRMLASYDHADSATSR
jgi:uncharacterized protein YegP (UPF0339 family)